MLRARQKESQKVNQYVIVGWNNNKAEITDYYYFFLNKLFFSFSLINVKIQI